MKLVFSQSSWHRWRCTVDIDGETLYTSAWWPTIGCAAKDGMNWIVKTYGGPENLVLDLGDW